MWSRCGCSLLGLKLGKVVWQWSHRSSLSLFSMCCCVAVTACSKRCSGGNFSSCSRACLASLRFWISRSVASGGGSGSMSSLSFWQWKHMQLSRSARRDSWKTLQTGSGSSRCPECPPQLGAALWQTEQYECYGGKRKRMVWVYVPGQGFRICRTPKALLVKSLST